MNLGFLKKKRKLLIIISAVVTTVAVLVSSFFIYVGDYYHADQDAIEVFTAANNIKATQKDDGALIFGAEDSEYGFIFYPGGKVEHTAYIPLMQSLAENNVFCVLLKMPFNLAVFDISAADGIKEQYPKIKNWYMGGHSLGGSMAASYLADHAEKYEGLILLGSYSTADLSQTDLDVLSVFGSEDKVMNRKKYEENKSNLPSDLTEYVIDGGCHAYFGMYGAQDGDGTPSITNATQIRLTVENIVKMMGE